MTPDDKLKLAKTLLGSAEHTPPLAAEEVAFVRQLEVDRARLKQLPRVNAPRSIAANVAKALPVTVVRQPQRQSAGWLPYFVAASVLLLVSLTSFLLFRNANDPNDRAKVNPTPVLVPSITPVDKPTPNHVAVATLVREELPLPGSKGSTVVAVKPVEPVMTNTPEDQKWLGARIITSLPDFQSITIRSPYLFAVHDLEQVEVRLRLAQELNAHPALRLDLFAKDSVKAIEHLTNAIKSTGAAVTMPSITTEQLKRKLPITVTLYSESLTAEEWSTVIRKLQAADSIGIAHLMAAGTAESKELKSLFGADLSVVKRSKEEPNRSVSDGTIGQVTQALNKPAKTAILTTAGPGLTRVNPAVAPEIRQFVDRRGERATNAVSMMIVVRVNP